MAKKLTVRRSDWFDVVNLSLLGLFSLAVLYPVWSQLVLSLSPVVEASTPGIHLWVSNPTLASYEKIFSTSIMPTAFFWSTLRVIVGCAISVFVCFCLAYPLSRKTLWKRNFWMAIMVFTMFFGGGLIPSYLVIRDLGMMNTFWTLVIPGAVVPFNVLLIRNYMMSLPEELVESAKIDGANDARILFSIIIPVCTPILATVTLWVAVGNWNAWFDAMLYLQNSPIRILQEILRAMLNEVNQQANGSLTEFVNQEAAGRLMEVTPQSVRAATLVVITLPIVATYPFLQKYFVKGVLMGSLKG